MDRWYYSGPDGASRLLVCCPRNSFTQPLDFGEDHKSLLQSHSLSESARGQR